MNKLDYIVKTVYKELPQYAVVFHVDNTVYAQLPGNPPDTIEIIEVFGDTIYWKGEKYATDNVWNLMIENGYIPSMKE